MPTLSFLTIIHTALSFIALVTGAVATARLFGARFQPSWTTAFLVTAGATSITGYAFPFMGVTPAQIFGVIALAALAAACFGLYARRLDGAWRWIWALGIVVNEYLLVFVTIVQAFLKIPALNALAPTQSEAPFAVAQLAALIVFAVLGVLAVRRFKPTGALAT